MKVLVAVLALAAAASARPGGYTANGGVYNFDPNVHLDYMDHARNAGKVLLVNRLDQIKIDSPHPILQGGPYAEIVGLG